MFGYKKAVDKDDILSKLCKDYTKFERGDRSDDEWGVLCALAQEMLDKGQARGKDTNEKCDVFEIFIGKKGRIKRMQGGFLAAWYCRIIPSAIAIIGSILAVVTALCGLW